MKAERTSATFVKDGVPTYSALALASSANARNSIGSSGIASISEEIACCITSLSSCFFRYSAVPGLSATPDVGDGGSAGGAPAFSRSTLAMCSSGAPAPSGCSASALLIASVSRSAILCFCEYASASSTLIGATLRAQTH